MKLGFIGAGNMASAIIKGLINSGSMSAESIYISRKNPEKSSAFLDMGIHLCMSNRELAQICDCIVLAIKPIYTADVIKEIYSCIQGKFIISIVGSWSYQMLHDALPADARFVRVMPNTPLAVGEGMSLISSKYTCTEDEFAYAKHVFECAGKVSVVEDHVYTAATSISGCGPAFVYQFIEALADGGVRHGVPRTAAYELAAQTLIGAAKMVLETGEHPGRLKDAVCSPGGSTIEGVYALEKGGMRAAVIDAVGAAVEKIQRSSNK